MNETSIIPENKAISLRGEIETLVKDLYYPSESDEKIDYFEIELIENQEVTIDFLKMALGLTPEKTICEWTVEDFFRPLLKMEDWYKEDEKEWVVDAENLKKLLLEKTTSLKVWKMGEIEITAILMGVHENKGVGVKTKLIET